MLIAIAIAITKDCFSNCPEAGKSCTLHIRNSLRCLVGDPSFLQWQWIVCGLRCFYVPSQLDTSLKNFRKFICFGGAGLRWVVHGQARIELHWEATKVDDHFIMQEWCAHQENGDCVVVKTIVAMRMCRYQTSWRKISSWTVRLGKVQKLVLPQNMGGRIVQNLQISGLVWSGLVWSGLVWSSLVWSSLV